MESTSEWHRTMSVYGESAAGARRRKAAAPPRTRMRAATAPWRPKRTASASDLLTRLAGHLPAQRLHDLAVAERFCGVTVEDDLAAVDRVEPVRDARGVAEIRLREEDRDAHRLYLVHRIGKARDDHRREPLERLVQQQDRRRERHGAGDRHHLLLPPAQGHAFGAAEGA